jgi:hypothetical protein
MFLVNFLSEFEEQFGLKILNWEVLSDSRDNVRPILIHHEPKEKKEEGHGHSPFEPDPFEPDIRL